MQRQIIIEKMTGLAFILGAWLVHDYAIGAEINQTTKMNTLTQSFIHARDLSDHAFENSLDLAGIPPMQKKYLIEDGWTQLEADRFPSCFEGSYANSELSTEQKIQKISMCMQGLNIG